MSDVSDDMIESMLREQFDGPVADDGFSERVMQVLPPRPRHRAWPLWLGIVVGMLACWLGLLRAPVLQTGWSDWLHGEFSMPAITVMAVMAGLSLLAAWWSVAETRNG
ncbi:MAG: DUF5056 domain-containing protein [Xanthomonadales bacterium]|nr:DUF5056 domain-containing protein [Xanthomonadales bacterium]